MKISEILTSENLQTFPEKGTPQGGIISPLLSNMVLNELDWWALKHSNLKEFRLVRYADDFKIFCRTRQDAEKLFVATKKWLKERLGLDISPEKSKIVNLRKHYSEFLGLKLKVCEKGKYPNGTKRYVILHCR